MKLTLCIVEFAVADIGDIKWSLSPSDFFAIPDEDKEIIVALAESRTARVPESMFDEAILSKIHVLLRYENLDRHARRDFCRNFLERERTSKGAANIGSVTRTLQSADQCMSPAY
jgi:hypothetical protein